MTDSSDSPWVARMRAALADLAGDEGRAAIDAAWAAHAERELVEVTLVGPYSSGKSSLLRRLLIEAGRPVPEWLTVSGRPETFELNETAALGLAFTDSPGTAAGAERHDDVAEDALALSDAFLLVVPPQLLTSGRDLMRAWLSGQHYFGQVGGDLPAVTLAAIARSDELGIDPEDNPEGLLDLIERKRSELRAVLAEASEPAVGAMPIHVVSADAWQESLQERDVGPDAFSATRGWDGIEALTRDLEGLAERKDELRARAQVRYLARVALDVRDQTRAVIDGLEQAEQELEARRSVLRSLGQQADSMLLAAKAELEERAAEAAWGAAEAGPTTSTEAGDATGERRRDAADAWAQKWNASFTDLQGRAGVEVDRRLDRPAAHTVEDFLSGLGASSPEADPAPNTRLSDLVRALRSEVARGAEGAFAARTGRKLGDVLGQTRNAGGGIADVPEKGAGATKGAGAAAKGGAAAAKKGAGATRELEKLERAAVAAQGAAQVADAVLAIAGALQAEREQDNLDRKRRAARDEARQRIQTYAASFAEHVIEGSPEAPGWRQAIDEWLDTVRVHLGIAADGDEVAALSSEARALEAGLERLQSLLAEGARLRPPT